MVRFRCIRSNGNARKRHETGNGNTGYPWCFQNGLTCFCHVSVYGFLQLRPVHVNILWAKCYIGSLNKIIYFWGKLTHPSFFHIEWQGKLQLFLKWKVVYLSSTSSILLSELLQQFVPTNHGCMDRGITRHNHPNPWSSIDGNHKHFQILIALEWT